MVRWRWLVRNNPDELGALWTKVGAKGEYMSGTINGIAVVCFKNDRKTGNQPDWRILKAKKREGAAMDEQQQARAAEPEW